MNRPEMPPNESHPDDVGFSIALLLLAAALFVLSTLVLRCWISE